MSIAFVDEVAIWEIIPPRLAANACFQSTFDREPEEVVGSIKSTSVEQKFSVS